MGLQEETADVLGNLIRFNTVNPPGQERECQEYLRDYLTEAGFECELIGAEDERPNLIATLRGEADGPVLGYLSHVDTVLASPEDWSRDPWSGELHDGHVWGRGALDMKSQTAAEVVAGAALAREGWRPPRGELKIMSVVDEEVGGRLGAQWLTQEHPDLVRCDYLLNEGAGPVIPYGDRRLFGVCCAEKGTFRFAVRTTRPRRPRLGPRARRQRAAQARCRSSSASATAARASTSPTSRAPSWPRSASTRTIPRRRCAASREVDDRLAKMVEPTMGVTFAPTIIARLAEDQRHPGARRAQGRLPRAARDGRRGDDGAGARGARATTTASRSSSSRR